MEFDKDQKHFLYLSRRDVEEVGPDLSEGISIVGQTGTSLNGSSKNGLLRIGRICFVLCGAFKQALKLVAQVIELGRGNIPNDRVVDPEIIVDEPVPHAGYGPPIHSWISSLRFRGRLLGRFSDNLNAAHEGTLESIVLEEPGSVQPMSSIHEVFRLVEHVSHILKPRERHTRPP